MLIDHARPWIDGDPATAVIEKSLQRWKFALPTTILPEPIVAVSTRPADRLLRRRLLGAAGRRGRLQRPGRRPLDGSRPAEPRLRSVSGGGSGTPRSPLFRPRCAYEAPRREPGDGGPLGFPGPRKPETFPHHPKPKRWSTNQLRACDKNPTKGEPGGRRAVGLSRPPEARTPSHNSNALLGQPQSIGLGLTPVSIATRFRRTRATVGARSLRDRISDEAASASSGQARAILRDARSGILPALRSVKPSLRHPGCARLSTPARSARACPSRTRIPCEAASCRGRLHRGARSLRDRISREVGRRAASAFSRRGTW